VGEGNMNVEYRRDHGSTVWHSMTWKCTEHVMHTPAQLRAEINKINGELGWIKYRVVS
jgi:hypothetical protein